MMTKEGKELLERLLPMINRILDTCHSLRGEGAAPKEVLVAQIQAAVGVAEYWGMTEKELLDLVQSCYGLQPAFKGQARPDAEAITSVRLTSDGTVN